MIVVLVACSGGASPEAPVAEPPVVPVVAPLELPPIVAEAPSTVVVTPPVDAATLLAGIPADHVGKHTPIVNELSGQTEGESVDLTADTDVFGVPCRGGDGALQLVDGHWGCVLSREATVGVWKLRADTFGR